MATYTSNYGWTKPSGSDNVDISVLNDNLDDQDSTIHDAFLNMAPPFSESSTYAVDDIVLYGTGLYKCHTAVVTPGSWTGSTNWQVYKLSEGGSGGGGTTNYNALTNKPQINSVELSGNKTAGDLRLQGELTFDNVPTDGSNNPVKSDGIYDSEKDIYAVMGEMGAKNLLYFPYDDSDGKVDHNVTYKVNNDGTVSAIGKCDNEGPSNFFFDKYSSDQMWIKPGRYIFSGAPEGNTEGYIWCRIYHSDNTNTLYSATAGSFIFDVVETDTNIRCGIAFNKDTGDNNISRLFKPMIRKINDTDDTYQPYAKTNRELTESYPANKVMMPDGVTSVADALDTTLATIEGTAHTVASGANHTESIPITYPTGYTRAIGVMGFSLGNSVLTPWQIEISGDNVTVSAFNHYTNSANAKTQVTLLFAK